MISHVDSVYRLNYLTKLEKLEQKLSMFEYNNKVLKEGAVKVSILPPLPKPGDNLGVFRSFMGWLLQIQSHSLVLIIGLVGFGLLGAAGATFIKETGRREKDGGPFVEDLPGVLIKGLSAALVVFLVFQGSLALLTGASNTPPDESLFFFLALSAAVFSDNTWDWARNKFEKTLDDIDKEGKSEQQKAPEKSESAEEKQ
jgi:hypothetical protein